MPDQFTEVSSRSWFGRIGNSITGILFGILFFLGAFPLLFWNEGRSVQRYKTLKEGDKAVVSIEADRVNPENEKKLVHLSSEAKTDEVLEDPVFGISEKALKLNRIVEMYQWKEKQDSSTRKKIGGGTETTTEYSYQKGWSPALVRSSGFKHPEGHQNPEALPFDKVSKTASRVEIGAFQLSRSLVGMIRDFEPLPVAGDSALPGELDGRGRIYDGIVYIGREPTAPEVGDARVSFEIVRPGVMSVMARQVGNSFEPYPTRAGGTIELISPGFITAETMIQHEQASNRLLTWGLRIGGFILMFIGLSMIFGILSVLADVLPILGDIVGVGTRVIAGLISALLSFVTIAIAWIYYRPLLGIGLIVVAAALGVMIYRKLSANRQSSAASVS